MDSHQRRMWTEMLDRIKDFRAGRVRLGKLVDDLKGLYGEADPHDPHVRNEFQSLWSLNEGENELRTEPWAPPGSASDETLSKDLDEFYTWVEALLMADTTDEHG